MATSLFLSNPQILDHNRNIDSNKSRSKWRNRIDLKWSNKIYKSGPFKNQRGSILELIKH